MSEIAVFLVNPASDNGGTGRRWPELAHRAALLGLEGETLFSERPGPPDRARRARGRRRRPARGRRRRRRHAQRGDQRRRAARRRPRDDPARHRHGLRPHLRPRDAVRRRRPRGARGEHEDDRRRRVRYRTWAGEEASRWFGNVGTVGMSGAVAQRVNGMSKALGGRVTFFYGLTRVFLSWKNTEVTVSLDDGERRGRMHDVIVANGAGTAAG